MIEGGFTKTTLGVQIADFLKDKIKKNEYKDGMLPKEEDLAVQLNVSRGTVRSAMAILEGEELITRIKKRGTMIRGFNLQFPDLKRVKRLNLFYFGGSTDFFSMQASGFYSFIFNAILAEASKRQYVLNVCLIEDGLQEKASLKRGLELEAEGNILFAITDEEIVKKILNSEKPSILIDHEFKDVPMECVNVDSYQGSYDSVQYLYDRGHRKILFLNHHYEHKNPDRIRGVRDAIRDLKIPAKNYHEIKMSPRYDASYATYLKVKDNFPQVTGIVAFGPEMAFGFIKGLEESGFSIPKDYSIISSGNISDQGAPKLTTMEFDLNHFGQIVISRLVDKIKGTNKGIENKMVRGRVTERGSVRDISK